MTAGTVRITATSAALVLASLAHSQESHLAQMHKEISEFNGMQFTYQFQNSGAGLQSKVVTGAPYQADKKSVMTQTLSDGNRIVQTTVSKIYRDQQGRTRLERSLKGTLPESGEIDKTVMINDPVASTHYVLDERNRTVMKGVSMSMQGAKSLSEVHHASDMAAKKTAEAKVSGGAPMPISAHRAGGGESTKTEDLGKQVLEGLSVEGTRTTVTIAAGAIFNERPIEIVSERWFSPDLQMVIMSKRNDPRMGETVYSVSNINRANPNASLFQVPAGYTENQEYATQRD